MTRYPIGTLTLGQAKFLVVLWLAVLGLNIWAVTEDGGTYSGFWLGFAAMGLWTAAWNLLNVWVNKRHENPRCGDVECCKTLN